MAEGLEIPRCTERQLFHLQELAPAVQLPTQTRSFLATHQSDRFCRNLPLSLIERTEAATTSRIMVERTWTETVIGRWNCIGTGVYHCNRRSGVVL